MRKALGRGLDSLLSKANVADPAQSTDTIKKIAIDKIRPNRYQPRRNFDETALAELSESIKERGLIQPISVWKDSDKDFYEIIAGERRLRACKLAGLKEIDAIIKKDLSDEQKLALALIENIQREDLNSIDTALAYKKLMEEFSISQADIARGVGKSRAAVSNTLRLLELSADIQSAIQSGIISEGHARALLSIPDVNRRKEVFQRIVVERLSVREVEKIAHDFLSGEEEPKQKTKNNKTPEIIALEQGLEKRIGTKVEILPSVVKNKGKIVICYYSLQDFERISDMLKK